MNAKQKGIMVIWLTVAGMLVSLGFAEDWLLNHWNTSKWPALLLVLLIITLARRHEGPAGDQGWCNLNETIDQHPWIRLYMAAYCLVIVGGAITIIVKNINITEFFGAMELTVALVGIMLPALNR